MQDPDSNNASEQEQTITIDPTGEEVDMQPDTGRSMPLIAYEKEIIVEEADLKCWIRLPNSFEHREIQQHALAARARKLRECKTPGSDSEAMVDQALSFFDDLNDGDLRTHLLDHHRREVMFDAIVGVEDDEKFANIEAHQSAYSLKVRSGDVEGEEFETLHAILTEYAEALEKEVETLVAPFQGKYDAMTRPELLEKIRKSLVMATINDEFTNVYAKWQIFYGARKHFNHRQKLFKTFDEMLDADARHVDILVEEFAILDALKSGELKKSQGATPSLLSSVPSES
jgi:hypothetical protein